MNKRILETILEDQAEELLLQNNVRFCHRKEEDLIDLSSPQAQVVIGVRRSGKSTLCYNALSKAGVKYAYVNFDDERLFNLEGKDLNDVLEVLYKINGDFNYLFIDEIQNIPEWYLFVNRLLRKQMHIVITGSNAKLLSSELATHLTGRHHSISLYPFSFEEYCDFTSIDIHSNTTKSIAARRAAFDEYLQQGGFPELQNVNNSRVYVQDLVESILKTDIVKRFHVHHVAAFEQLAHHLLNIAPSIIVDKNLQETFDFKSRHTAKNYVSYLKQAYLLVGLHKYSMKSRLRIVGEKVYPIDVSLMNSRENAFAGENLGWRLETIVYLHLRREYIKQGMDIYYYKEGASECDFVVCNGRKPVLAIQVAYDISSDKTKKREIRGLVNFSKKSGCDNLLLLTDHEYANVDNNGKHIRVRPVYDYVISKE